jgi:hypothetical protein
VGVTSTFIVSIAAFFFFGLGALAYFGVGVAKRNDGLLLFSKLKPLGLAAVVLGVLGCIVLGYKYLNIYA